jgi:hypothetical protein
MRRLAVGILSSVTATSFSLRKDHLQVLQNEFYFHSNDESEADYRVAGRKQSLVKLKVCQDDETGNPVCRRCEGAS